MEEPIKTKRKYTRKKPVGLQRRSRNFTETQIRAIRAETRPYKEVKKDYPQLSECMFSMIRSGQRYEWVD